MDRVALIVFGIMANLKAELQREFLEAIPSQTKGRSTTRSNLDKIQSEL